MHSVASFDTYARNTVNSQHIAHHRTQSAFISVIKAARRVLEGHSVLSRELFASF